MKHLILIVLTATLFSCSNKKAAIVEELNRQKDTLIVYQMAANGFSHAATHVLVHKTLTTVDSGFLKQQNYNSNLSAKSLDSMKLIWEAKSIRQKSVVDSLELELKKY